MTLNKKNGKTIANKNPQLETNLKEISINKIFKLLILNFGTKVKKKFIFQYELQSNKILTTCD